MQQYFYDKSIETSEIMLNDEQSHHIKNVLRMKENTFVRVVDIHERVFVGKVQYRKSVHIVALEEKIEDSEIPVQITLIASLIKKDKWDFLLQKASELGVHRIIALNASRSVVKIDKNDTKKLERFNKITMEACEQARRKHHAKVEAIISFKEIDQYLSTTNVIAYEAIERTSTHLKHAINTTDAITILIGPEGGFTEQEVTQAREKGFRLVHLGKRILRAETAAFVALHTVGLHYE